MGHGHGHDHGVSAETDRRRLVIALALLLVFAAGEVVVGLLAGSVALLADAGHMTADAAALGLALLAIGLAARPPRGALTYGLKRAEPASALVNAVTLIVLAAVFAIQAISRLIDPADVDAGLVLAVALAGIPVNLAATWVLAGADRRSVNVEGAFQHVVTDLYAFVATAIAATVILATGFDRADPIAALLVAALMLRAAWGLLRESGRIFLEAAPAGVDVAEIGNALAAAPGVTSVHDLHVWELTSGFAALSAHVVVGAREDCHARRAELDALLHARFGIDHATLQVEHDQGLLTIEPAP
ncbi:MAG TPA: cation diffusion facilitator family transporter [Solirubrobacteraceae bacterium]|jgi:cobalt-zinc-cadmium efflux system protein